MIDELRGSLAQERAALAETSGRIEEAARRMLTAPERSGLGHKEEAERSAYGIHDSSRSPEATIEIRPSTSAARVADPARPAEVASPAKSGPAARPAASEAAREERQGLFRRVVKALTGGRD
ncbi:MAG: hypothetical protein R3D33_13600 [Hyphomicrobiaceae bacterium]